MYLPFDNDFKIEEMMLIDFSQIFHTFREDLEWLRNLRLCRLKIYYYRSYHFSSLFLNLIFCIGFLSYKNEICIII
jgi:hypothetical protein